MFIYCIWVSTRWQWSVDLCINRNETAHKEKRYTEQYKDNTKSQIKQNRKQKQITSIKRISKRISGVIRKYQKEGNNNLIIYCTEPKYSYIKYKSMTIHTFHPRSSLHPTPLHFTSHHFNSLHFTTLSEAIILIRFVC